MYWIIILLVILILIYLSYKYGQSSCEINHLLGFWESPPEFNKESSIDMCTFYIGKKENGKYTAYILMVEEDNMIINEPCKFVLSESIFYNSSADVGCREFKINLSDFDSDVWPSEMTMRYYPYTNKIILNDFEKIYMVLYKNPILSELEQCKKDKTKQLTKQLTKQEIVVVPENDKLTDVN
jgi:hypothetical protein